MKLDSLGVLWHVPSLHPCAALHVAWWLLACDVLPSTNEDCTNLRLHGMLSHHFSKTEADAPWPCVNQRVCMLEVPASYPYNYFAWCFGMSVGEATHPGPVPTLRPLKLVVSNPTAVHKKCDELWI